MATPSSRKWLESTSPGKRGPRTLPSGRRLLKCGGNGTSAKCSGNLSQHGSWLIRTSIWRCVNDIVGNRTSLKPRRSRWTRTPVDEKRAHLAEGPFLPYGAPGEIRTPGLLVRSQTLYPAELRARGDAHSRGRRRRGQESGSTATLAIADRQR